MTNPTNEHGEQAQEKGPERVWITWDDAYPWDTPETGGEEYIRAVGIREVLEGLTTYAGAGERCWCRTRRGGDSSHSASCAATRALYAKLQPLPSENPHPKVRE